MNHPWLTTTDWPVSASDGNAARNTAISATSRTVVNPPSMVSFSITVLITSVSDIPSSRACSGGVRTESRDDVCYIFSPPAPTPARPRQDRTR